MVSRLNDAILLTREMVKQRWSPMAILSMGPGWNENDYFKTLGKLADGPMSFIPWYDPTKKLSQQFLADLGKAYPDLNMNEKHVYTFEALLVAADAFKRAGSTDPKALVDAIRTTISPTMSALVPGIMFNEKGQNDKLKCAAIQNRAGKFVDHRAQGSGRCQARAADDPVQPTRLKRRTRAPFRSISTSLSAGCSRAWSTA